jgi:hypothetical protein
MYQAPSLFSLTVSLESEWAGSTPLLRRHGSLSFIIWDLLDACREDRKKGEGRADEESTRQWVVMWKDIVQNGD